MNIWKISLSNIFHKPMYAFLSVLSLSISIGLLFGIEQLDASIQHQFENSLGNIDMVLGAKGSPLQLVLASVMHMDNPTGNISLAEAQRIAKNPLIETAVPISYGDNYKGYRIVGTNQGFKSLYNAQLAEGRPIKKSMEVILGSTVATASHLKIGDTLLSSHGLIENSMDVHERPLKVVGVYKPTNKIIDRLIVTNLQTIWDVHHHGKRNPEADYNEQNKSGVDRNLIEGKSHNHEEDHDDQNNEHTQQITSMLITFKNPMGLLTMPRQVNERTSMQAALPKFELERLFNFTDIGVRAVSWIAYIILAISCVTIFISLFKMVRERAFDLALMRSYGASNFQLIRVVAYEGFTIVLFSLLIGVVLSQVGLHFAFAAFQTGYNQKIHLKIPYEQLVQTVSLILAMSTLAIAIAIIPIAKMNVSKILSREK